MSMKYEAPELTVYVMTGADVLKVSGDTEQGEWDDV